MARKKKSEPNTVEVPAAGAADGAAEGPEEPVAEDLIPPACERAQKTIRNYMIASMAAGLVPVPAVDVAAITAIQLKMLHTIAGEYSVPFMRDAGKSVVASLIGGIGASSIARGTFGSLVKFIPVVGPLAGAVTLPIVAGAATYAVGKIFVQHFEAGGTFLDFDPEKVRTIFQKHYQEGEKVATDLRPKAEAAAAEEAQV